MADNEHPRASLTKGMRKQPQPIVKNYTGPQPGRAGGAGLEMTPSGDEYGMAGGAQHHVGEKQTHALIAHQMNLSMANVDIKPPPSRKLTDIICIGVVVLTLVVGLAFFIPSAIITSGALPNGTEASGAVPPALVTPSPAPPPLPPPPPPPPLPTPPTWSAAPPPVRG